MHMFEKSLILPFTERYDPSLYIVLMLSSESLQPMDGMEEATVTILPWLQSWLYPLDHLHLNVERICCPFDLLYFFY